MAKIIILDENTACRIAAGEVVERPVSVIKELVENSLDAGAGSITVSISGGGLDSITVVDNGCGISQGDLPLAFQRHATSKIESAEDLFRIKTLGFRGEALPSIAAVSDMTIKTRTNESNEGRYLHIRGGRLIEDGPVGCPVGTVVSVRELFFNTPARLKHLKSKATESGLINEIINKLALINSNTAFLLTHNGRPVFQSNGSGNLLETVAAVYGIDAANLMIPVICNEDNVCIEGYISKPDLSRSTRQQITTSVNGRIVRNAALNNAIEEGYRGFLTVGRYPVVILLLSIPQGLLDVNVHPAKMEIKIETEEKIKALMRTSIRSALNKVNLIPGVKQIAPELQEKVALPPCEEPYQLNLTPTSGLVKSNLMENEIPDTSKEIFYEKAASAEKTFSDYNAVKEESVITDRGMQKENQISLETKKTADRGTEKHNPEIFPELEVLGQIMNMYIIAGNDERLYIIDQHAAHERVFFEKFYSGLIKGSAEVQYLLEPISIDLKHYEKDILTKHENSFKALGFVLEDFGGDTVLLRGIPANYSAGESQQLIIDMTETLVNTGELVNDELNFKLAALMACKAAIKAGDGLTIDAMQALIKLLSKTKEPFTCPHGRPTIISFTHQQLDLLFKRT